MKRYTSYFDSPLGLLEIQCSDDHVLSAVFVGGQNADRSEHPLLLQTITQFTEYFTGKRRTFHLPLLQAGTPFQQKIWMLLNEIPFGKTISYQQLALQYDDLKAIRAVAAANGKNKLAILVPCHRVVGSNQSLTGYAGGLWRKKWLLQHELKYSGVQQLEML